MEIILNDKTIPFPTSLADITLGRRIRFDDLYGHELGEMLEEIKKIEDPAEQETDILNYNYEKMLRVFGFFADENPESLRQSEFIDVIAVVYFNRLAEMFDDLDPEEPKTSFQFKEEEWFLSEPELANGSPMTFGEFIDAKQLVKDMLDSDAGKWRIIQYLAAIYLRKKDEQYQENFLYDNSERLKLMEELPMDIAKQVDFFLSATTSFSTLISKSSEKVGLRESERTLGSILSNTDGSTFSNQSHRQRCLIYRVQEKTASIVPVRRGS